jgi:epoxyqueuosine reductase
VRPTDTHGQPVVDGAYVADLTSLTAPFGVTRTGVAPADVLQRARAALHHRLDTGLTDGMQFTFKNPERSTEPRAAVRDARSIFVAARPYLLADDDGAHVDAVATADPRGRIARYAWLDHYAPLREALWAVTTRLRADGWKAVPFADDNSIVDREVAYLAGIGWFGKNANLLVPGAGSWFVLGCVVTTAPLPVNDSPAADGCGTCRRCLDGCPTAAIVAPGVVDATRCLAWVLQKPGIVPRDLRVAVGDRMYGCDDCQEVCPPSVRLGPRRALADPADSTDEPRRTVDVLHLLGLDDGELVESWGRWYLAGREARWARRNALVVLGNPAAGEPADVAHRVAAVLGEYVAHADPVLRAHAVWAAARRGLTHLMPDSDPDPDVRAELVAARAGAAVETASEDRP